MTWSTDSRADSVMSGSARDLSISAKDLSVSGRDLSISARDLSSSIQEKPLTFTGLTMSYERVSKTSTDNI